MFKWKVEGKGVGERKEGKRNRDTKKNGNKAFASKKGKRV